MITTAFNIALPNKPYVDNFSDNTVHGSNYAGFKFIKVIVDANGWVVNAVSEADTMDEVNAQASPVPAGCSAVVVDGSANPFEAAFITGRYTTGAVAAYEESLGTNDANGDPEVWTYTWGEDGVLNQIYLHGTLKYVDGAFVAPQMRTHALTRQMFLDSLAPMSQGLTDALTADDANTVYTAAERQAIVDHKTYVDNISTKYAAVDHWKIPFKPMPKI
jgi:hypothetical protein